MKKQVRYRIITIPNKLSIEVRMLFDDSRRSAEYTTESNGDTYTTITFYPIIGISLIRTNEIDENGQRITPPWNSNDHLSMTRFQFPLFINELNKIVESIKIPEMFSYVNRRLVVNEELADIHRRVFPVGMGRSVIIVEMLPVVLTQPDESRIEGIKLKFNNEQSSVLLTLNEITSILYNLENLQLDILLTWIHDKYFNIENIPKVDNIIGVKNIDIKPKGDMSDLL